MAWHVVVGRAEQFVSKMLAKMVGGAGVPRVMVEARGWAVDITCC